MEDPAFPQQRIIVGDASPSEKKSRGMTLRDYFAAKAMQSIILADWPDGPVSQEVAESSYYIADAMMAERMKCEKKKIQEIPARPETPQG